jgi:APA family basic amino acid/polyamine antiporter
MTSPEDPGRPAVEVIRAITRRQATAMVIGTMIGAGVFIVTADIVRQVHYPGMVLLTWVLAGAVLVAGGITYAELGGMFPRAGGLYVYLREGISPLVGYLYGWTLFAVIWTGGTAAAATGFARYTGVVFPALTPELWAGFTVNLPSGPIEVGISPQRLTAVASILVITWINIRGVKTAAVLQTAFTFIKVGAVLALIALGFTLGRNPTAVAANFGSGFWPEHVDGPLLAAFAAAMVGPIFSMDGWYSLCFAASEMVDGRRDLPRALITGTIFGGLLFLALNAAYLMVLPSAAIGAATEDRVASAVMEAIWGPVGGKLMAAAIMVSSFGLNLGIVLGGGRLFYAMAKDGVFFRSFGQLHPEYRTPATALRVQGLWVAVLCLSGTFGQLIDFTTVASLLFFVLVPVALFVLRRTRPDADRPYRATGYPFVPAFYTLASAWVFVQLTIQRPQYTWPGLMLMALGLPIYFLSPRGRPA